MSRFISGKQYTYERYYISVFGELESNDEEIIFEWDIDERNIAEYDDIGAIEKLIINEKYKKYFLNLRIEIKKGITYWK